jgi:hypothetical protein
VNSRGKAVTLRSNKRGPADLKYWPFDLALRPFDRTGFAQDKLRINSVEGLIDAS